MVRVILDTNIYGKISDDTQQGPELIKRIISDSNFIIFNFRLIRNELRRAPRLLPLYDTLVSKNIIQEITEIKKLAQDYFKEYKINKGIQNQHRILNDFKIVACASLNNCDLVCTDDLKTMRHPLALKAYKVVNLKSNLRTPTFYSYEELKRTYL